MRFTSSIGLLPVLGTAVSAWDAPSYSGYTLVWSDNFAGPSGSLPNQNNWNIISGNLGVNGELETYVADPHEVQTSGGNTVQLVPWLDGSSWTSGRIESKYTFTPQAGKKTMVEAPIRFGSNDISTKQGIWPAFWLLGDSIRHGTAWPECGELDILETIDGQLTGYGTAHCDVTPGGICNEPNGIGGSIGMPSQDWQTWRLVWDRTTGNWQTETITWYMNGQQFHQISGSRIGDQNVWNSLAASPLYFILNVAVGGNWPGYPNSQTQGGYGAMMEVGYVAHYSS
ncbi:73c81e02-086d-4723-b724-89170a70891b [Thermothielavioides terrestris]|uniref:Glycoside hydrolase family 16 protein n=2 Tax=Thermothielavioides terrestris TaxID=2587410 RepID=G2QYS1_THETT|nr:glycoside hydrolase family 16 protein [Thermothielavioides terrestris NRRL 8126]AEO66263.1 glycoside hydrolase family 16 protein [Thermothielavioides terrestris NRRL 8126]SPQ25372.1 73c81e02-086d-4723-b724-89170a70891b [Thermothielavioides terrestris]